jgi:hypothetical protein
MGAKREVQERAGLLFIFLCKYLESSQIYGKILLGMGCALYFSLHLLPETFFAPINI